MKPIKGLVIAYAVIIIVAAVFIVIDLKNPDQPEIEEQPAELTEFTQTSWWQEDTQSTYRVFHVRYGEDKNDIFSQKLKIDVAMVEGVCGVHYTPYKLGVSISPVYDWHEIEPKIKDLIIKFENIEPEPEKVEGDI